MLVVQRLLADSPFRPKRGRDVSAPTTNRRRRRITIRRLDAAGRRDRGRARGRAVGLDVMNMAEGEDEETVVGRAWRRATTIGPAMVDVTRQVAHALGPTSPYHRHDFIVIALAAVVVAVAAFGHRRMVEPSVEVFQTRGLTFTRPAIWLAPEVVPPITPRLVIGEPPRPRPPDAELPYHVVYTSPLDSNVRMEVRIEAAPGWRNIITGLELDRRTRWGELYSADASGVRTIAGHDWLRTASATPTPRSATSPASATPSSSPPSIASASTPSRSTAAPAGSPSWSR
jgi:hypothetical protein